MTNPTSNFGWQMPTSTDLVTDLPADFEVFGQAVDTDFVDLLGGANGYILSKASATDLDFAWIPNDQGDITAVNVTSPITGGGSAGAVTIGVSAASTGAAGVVQLSDSTSTTSSVLAATPTAVKAAFDKASTAATTSVAGIVQLSDSISTTSSVLASTPTATKSAYDLADAAIAKSLVTTAGDIIYRNATVPARLGIGTAGQVLAVNSGATAPEWKTAGMTLISRTTFSNTAAATIDSVFSSTYYSYLINIEYIYGAVTTDELHLQLRYGAVTQAANYLGSSRGLDSSGNLTSVLTSGAAFKIWERISGSDLPSNVSLTINRVGNTSEKAQWHGTGLYGNTPYSYFTGGEVNTAQTYTGFLLKSSSSNVTGAVSVYGLGK